MPDYKDFLQKARERFEERQKRKLAGVGGYVFTLHSQYKMKQYGLSEQKVRGVIRNPKRKEEGIVPRTTAVMQPVSEKTVNGKPSWKQEIWVMYQFCNSKATTEAHKLMKLEARKLKIISAWRYPGMSPKRNPIPDEILRELADGSILEQE